MSSSAPRTVDARSLVDQVLADAVRLRASDVHFEPTAQGLEVRLMSIPGSALTIQIEAIRRDRHASQELIFSRTDQWRLQSAKLSD